MSFRAAGNVADAGSYVAGAPLVVPVPVGTEDGDFLLLLGSNRAGSGSFSLPSGWIRLTDIEPSRTSSDHINTVVAYRIASSEPSDYHITNDTSAETSAVIVAYSGVTGLDVVPTTAHKANYFDNNTPVPPSIVTETDNATVLTIQFVSNAEITSAVPPTGYNLRLDHTPFDDRNILLADSLVPILGAEVPDSWQHSSFAEFGDSSVVTLALHNRRVTLSPLDEPFELDLSNPLTAGLKGVYLPSQGGNDLVNLIDDDIAVLSNVSGSLSKVTATGIGVVTNCDSSDDDNWVATNPVVLDNDVGATVFTLCRYQSSSNFAYGVLSNRDVGRQTLKVGPTQGLLSEYDQGFSKIATTLMLTDQFWHYVGHTQVGGVKRFFLDDSFESVGSPESGRTTTIKNIGTSSDTSRGFVGQIALIFAFERDLLDSEILSLQVDPFQLFKSSENQAPVANDITYSMGVNVPNGYTVATFVATDSDGSIVTYSITGSVLGIDNSGVITLLDNAGLVVGTPILATVTATDNLGLTDTALITVDVVVPPPIFSSPFSSPYLPILDQVVTLAVDWTDLHPDSFLRKPAYSDLAAGDQIDIIGTSPGGYTVTLGTDGLLTLLNAENMTSEAINYYIIDASDTYARSGLGTEILTLSNLILGTFTASLLNMASSGTSSLKLSATLSPTLAGGGTTTANEQISTTTLDKTLLDALATSSAELVLQSTITSLLDSVSSSNTIKSAVTGSLNNTLETFLLSSTVSAKMTNSLSQTLEDLSTVFFAGDPGKVIGIAGAALDGYNTSFVSNLISQGTVSAGIDNLGTSGTLQTTLSGGIDSVQAGIGLTSGSVGLSTEASINTSLGELSASATSGSTLIGNMNKVLEDLPSITISQSVTRILGAINAIRGDATSSGDTTLVLDGTLDGQVDNSSVSNTSGQKVTGNITFTLEEYELAVNEVLRLLGTVSTSLVSLDLLAGIKGVVGTLPVTDLIYFNSIMSGWLGESLMEIYEQIVNDLPYGAKYTEEQLNTNGPVGRFVWEVKFSDNSKIVAKDFAEFTFQFARAVSRGARLPGATHLERETYLIRSMPLTNNAVWSVPFQLE